MDLKALVRKLQEWTGDEWTEKQVEGLIFTLAHDTEAMSTLTKMVARRRADMKSLYGLIR